MKFDSFLIRSNLPKSPLFVPKASVFRPKLPQTCANSSPNFRKVHETTPKQVQVRHVHNRKCRARHVQHSKWLCSLGRRKRRRRACAWCLPSSGATLGRPISWGKRRCCACGLRVGSENMDGRQDLRVETRDSPGGWRRREKTPSRARRWWRGGSEGWGLCTHRQAIDQRPRGSACATSSRVCVCAVRASLSCVCACAV